MAAALCAVVGVLCACASVPPPSAMALPAVPVAYAGLADPAARADLPAAPAAAWWRAFADPALDALVERALQANPDIEAAAARLAQARALLRGSEASQAPQATLSAGANRQGGPLLNAAGASGTLVTTGVSVSYEFDLFGRWARARTAATLDAQARAALLQAARLLVQADVAQAYFALRALDAESQAARAGVQAGRSSLRLTEQRWQAGALPEQAVLRLRTELATSLAEAAALDRRRVEVQHALAVLLGEFASDFTLAAWADPQTQPTVLPLVPAGLPSQLLVRRPDVRAAQQAWAAAQARAGEARAAWWPSLALTASGGQASPGLVDLLQAGSRAWGLGVLLALPVLDGGRRDAAIAQADAATQAASAAYRAQVLAAFRDVEDQLTALSSLTAQAGWQAQAEVASTRARALAESRLQLGLASQLDLLDAQRSELRSRRLRLQAQAAQAQATVALIKALGGGWGGSGGV